MLCERCEAQSAAGQASRVIPSVGRVWGQHRLGDLLCATCGAILAAEGFAARLTRKRGQLARFGLESGTGPLLETAKRKV
jgi:hypothetical protein